MKNNTIIDNMIDAQQKAVDSVMENTKKLTQNTPMAETVEKSTAMYQEWINKQKETLDNAGGKMEHFNETIKENMKHTQDFFQNWMNMQQDNAKKIWEMNQNFLNNFNIKEGNNANPFTTWMAQNPFINNNNTNPFSDYFTQMKTWMNQAQQTQKWMELMNSWNPAKISESMNNWFTGMPNMMNSYYELLNSSFSELQKNMKNSTTQDVYANMVNGAASFGKFVEMWTPFWNSIQDKSFSLEKFKSVFNVSSLKDIMDNTFKMMPESVSTYWNQATEQMNTLMKDYGQNFKTSFADMKNMMNEANPFTQYNYFANMMEVYTKMNEWMNTAVSPIAKMITPNEYTKSASAWASIFDMMAVYSIKNSELQYMMYLHGQKAMEALAENVATKIEAGTEVESLDGLYQEWLNLSDSVFVELFESDEYSKLMAEVSAIQLKLKKEMDKQTEKALSKFPIATQSELDEIYKIIYDLKKEVRQLEKMLEINSEETVETTATAKTTTKKAVTRK